MKNYKFIVTMFLAIAAIAVPMVLRAHVSDVLASGITAAIATGPMVGTSGRNREILQYLKSAVGDDMLISQSYLRVEETVSNTTNVYNFDILKENGQDSPVEVKLDKNDLFVVTHLAGYIIDYSVAAGVVKYNAVLQTHPNASAFNVTGHGTIVDLNTFYNGNLSIEVGRIKYFDKYPAHLLARYPITPQTAATNYSDRQLVDGAAAVEPIIFLSGGENNVIKWNVPLWTGFAGADADAATSLTKVVFHPYGFLVSGGAKKFNAIKDFPTMGNR